MAEIGAERNYDDKLLWRVGIYDPTTDTWVRQYEDEATDVRNRAAGLDHTAEYEVENLVGNQLRIQLRVADADGAFDNDKVIVDSTRVHVCACVYHPNRTYNVSLSESEYAQLSGPLTVSATVNRTDGSTDQYPLYLQVNDRNVTTITTTGTHNITVNKSVFEPGENRIEFWMANTEREAAGYVIESSTVRAQTRPALGLSTNTTRTSKTLTVSYTVTNNRPNPATGVQLNLTDVPAAWSVRNHSDAGATWLPDAPGWFWQRLPPNVSRTATVVFGVPNGTANQSYSIAAHVSDASGHATTVYTNQTATVEPEPVLDLAAVNGSQQVNAGPGSTVTLTYNVTNTNVTPRTGVKLDIGGVADEWSVVSQRAGSATWVETERVWLWQSIAANRTASVELTLRVPENATAGTYQVPAVITDASGNTDTVNTTVEVGS